MPYFFESLGGESPNEDFAEYFKENYSLDKREANRKNDLAIFFVRLETKLREHRTRCGENYYRVRVSGTKKTPLDFFLEDKAAQKILDDLDDLQPANGVKVAPHRSRAVENAPMIMLRDPGKLTLVRDEIYRSTQTTRPRHKVSQAVKKEKPKATKPQNKMFKPPKQVSDEGIELISYQNGEAFARFENKKTDTNGTETGTPEKDSRDQCGCISSLIRRFV